MLTRRLLWSAMVLAGLCALAQADPPKLVRCTPANGARDVPTDLGAVRLGFDQPMKTDKWTLRAAEGGLFPPKALDADDPWLDPQTFHLKIQTLKPNTTYRLQLNDPERQGFRSAEGDEALPPTLISFTTGAGPKPAGSRPIAGPAQSPATAQPARSPASSPATTQPASSPAAATRPAGAPILLTPQALLGTWVGLNEQAEFTLTFSADGSCLRKVRTATARETSKTTYRLRDDSLVLTPVDGGEPFQFKAKLVDEKTLELTEAGERPLALTRK